MKLEHLLNHPADSRLADVRDAVSSITARFGREYIRECAARDEHPQELVAALAASGLLGLGVDEKWGGQGGGQLEQVALVEALGRAGVPASSFLIANFTRHLVLRFGTQQQIDAFVPGTLDGTLKYSFALTEPDAGTNSFAMRTKAERVGGEYVINGEKCFISWIGTADKAMLVARTSPYDPADKTGGLSVFLADLPAEGLTTTRMRINQGDSDGQYIVSLQDLRLPATALIGEEGKGSGYIFSALNSERVLASAMAIGLATYLLAKAARYAADRAPFGRSIGSYQAVQHPLAKAFIGLRAARSLTYEAAEAIDLGQPAGVVSNSAKYLATEYACDAVDAAIQTHGGYAFDEDYDVITFYRALRLLRVAPINNEMVLNFIAERVLELPSSR